MYHPLEKHPTHIISCDWGTSRLRLRLVSFPEGEIVAESASEMGIAKAYSNWQAAGRPDRLPFYGQILEQALATLQQESNAGMDGSPVVISGMASSSIGLKELPYGDLPFAITQPVLPYEELDTIIDHHPAFLLSGLSDNLDVMRGEETQVMGLYRLERDLPNSMVLILPGTHSKHIFIRDAHIHSFQTHMTGDVFQALMTNTVLKATKGEDGVIDDASFSAGVIESPNGSLLNQVFRLRARSLLNQEDNNSIQSRLSGLLIGHELITLQASLATPLLIAGDGLLHTLYQQAASLLLPRATCIHISPETLHLATIAGHLAWLENFL